MTTRLLFIPLLAVTVAAENSVREENYHGWPKSIILSNRKVEAVIVPAIGRVMQFRFAGETDGPFWENRALDGKAPDAASKDWGNFGGDKTWPAPQASWPRVTPRAWPPPVAFDSMPVEAKVDAGTVTLVSPTDPHYGIRTVRKISLDSTRAVMRIETTYEKVAGEPVRAGVWIITQLKDPARVEMPLPQNTLFPSGYNKQSETLPADLKVDNGIVSCTRSRTASTKIGSDADKLIWRDKQWKLTIESTRISGLDYPDSGSSAEVYTNPDPLQYVELELLGPLHELENGSRISQTNTYRLERVIP